MQNAIARKSYGVIRSFVASDTVAITFDDGPDPKYTPALLEVLDQYAAKATFFVIGTHAEAYPSILDEIKDRGHALGNHSYSHPSFSLLSLRQRISEIRKCERAIGSVRRKLFRPPYGHSSGLSPLIASLLGYDTVCWSVDAQDWENENVAWMFERLKQQTTGGSVILLHDRLETATDRKYFDRGPMLKLTARYLDYFAGIYKFITLPDMLKKAHAQRVDWDVAISDQERELRKDEISRLAVNTEANDTGNP